MTTIADKLITLKKTLPAEVTLVAVSKTKPPSMILEAYEAGQRDFGENYVQELVAKQSQLPEDIRWHFIGHLQSNKVKYIAPFVHLIHGVDSEKLLWEINKQGPRAGRTIHCLLQLHVASEETKYGFDLVECENVLKASRTKDLKNVSIDGVRAMASNTDNQ